MPLTAETWPIAAMLLQFPNAKRDGTNVQDDPPEAWRDVFDEVRDAGFTAVDVTDGWLRLGDLTEAKQNQVKQQADEAGLTIPAISLVRRSVIDELNWEDNLAFTHRTIDAAASIGTPIVSIGLHQALTEAQKQQLWFWTVDGHKDPDNAETWSKAVSRIQELADHAASQGVQLSLEMYEDTYLGTADSAVKLKTDIDRPNVGLNPDAGNLVRLHRPIEDWREILEKTLPHANYWHVKNYYRDEDRAQGIYIASPAPMEFGIISYREAVKIALKTGYTGAFCCEHYGGDGLSVSATNEKYLRGLLRGEEKRAPKHADNDDDSATKRGEKASTT